MKHLATRNLISLALSVQMLAGLPLLASAAYFTDTQSHWASQDIQALSNRNILGGYPDGTFRPYGSITRAEYATVLVKALNLQPSVPAASSFSDVSRNFWAYSAIETVRANGLVGGYPNGTFMPNRSISRAEALAILVSAARVPLPDATRTEQILSQYADAATTPAWARPAVAAAIQSGLYENDPAAGNRIEPLQPASRAEVAALVNNLLQPQGGIATGAQPGTTTTTTTSTGIVTTTTGGQTTLQGRITTVPAETKFTGTLNAPISTEFTKVGDPVALTLDQPLVSSDGLVVVPAGSQIIGRVSQASSAGRTGRPGELDIDFNEIVLPNGQRITIVGSVATEEGVLKGDTTKGRILKAAGATALGAGLGAALGTAMGPLSGGEVGRGAIYGTAVGAGVGAIAAAAMKGKEVVVTPGDRLEVKLDRPITLEVGGAQQP